MEPLTLSARTLEFVTRGNNKTVRYSLSDEDFATLARAVEFEGPPQAAVAWTLVQRFAYVYPAYKRLSDFISAYCQPINPAWFPGGKALVAYTRQLRLDGKDSQAQLEELRAKRRPWQAKLPISSVSPRVRQIVDGIFRFGATSPIPSSVHFRAPVPKLGVNNERIPYVDVAEAKEARKAFAKKRGLLDTVDIGDPRTENWFFGETSSHLLRVKLFVQSTSGVLGALALFSALAIWWANRAA